MYITVQHMVDSLGAEQLSRILDVDADADLSANSLLLQKIAAANGQIESYVSNVAQTPLAEVPAQLIEHGVAIATWFLVNSRPEITRDSDKTRYDDAIKYLRDIAAGRGSVDLGAVTLVAGARAVRMNENLVQKSKLIRIVDQNVDPEGRM